MSLSHKDFYRNSADLLGVALPFAAAGCVHWLGTVNLHSSFLAIASLMALGSVVAHRVLLVGFESAVIERRLTPEVVPAVVALSCFLLAGNALLEADISVAARVAPILAETGLIALALGSWSRAANHERRGSRTILVAGLVLAALVGTTWLELGAPLHGTIAIASCLLVTQPWLFDGIRRRLESKAFAALDNAGLRCPSLAILEALSNAKRVVVRRRGLLTRGRPAIAQVVSIDEDRRPEDILRLAAAAELSIKHPIRDAIFSHRDVDRGTIPTVKGVTNFPGRGVQAFLQGREVICGNLRLLADLGWSPEQRLELEQRCKSAREPGQSQLFVALDGRCIGFVTLRDTLRPGLEASINALVDIGLRVSAATADTDNFETLRQELATVELLDEADPATFAGRGTVVISKGALPRVGSGAVLIEWILDDERAMANGSAPTARVYDRDLADLAQWVSAARSWKSRCTWASAAAMVFQGASWALAAGALAGWGLTPTPLIAGLCAGATYLLFGPAIKGSPEASATPQPLELHRG